MPDFAREHASRHFDDGCIVKGLRKTLRVDRRRRDDDLEIGSLGKNSFDVTDQKIDVQATLVRFINNQGVIIKDIDFGSSGERTGLRVGDVILTVNNKIIKKIDDIMKIIEEGLYQSNDFIKVGILRNGNEVFYQIQLEGTTKQVNKND